MSIKAGRVGVNPADVDPVDGHITPSSVDSYTKTEADAKFETQSHAASTYETKTDAVAALAGKQSIQLRVPIELLSGSALTVESAIKGVNDLLVNARSIIKYTAKTTDTASIVHIDLSNIAAYSTFLIKAMSRYGYAEYAVGMASSKGEIDYVYEYLKNTRIGSMTASKDGGVITITTDQRWNNFRLEIIPLNTVGDLITYDDIVVTSEGIS